MSFLGYRPEEWIDIGLSLLLVLFVAVVGRWLINLIFLRLLKHQVDPEEPTLRSVLLDGLRVPLYWLLVVIALDVEE